MSLRTRIILLFVGLAVVPLLVLAAVSYWHAQSLVKEGLRAQVAETAETMGREAWSSTVALRRGMETLAARVFISSVSGDPSLEEAPEEELPEELRGVQFVRVLHASGASTIRLGAVPAGATRCESTGGSRLIRLSSSNPLSGQDGGVEVGVWASGLLPAQGRLPSQDIRLVEEESGRVLYSSDCGELEGGAEAVLVLESSSGAGPGPAVEEVASRGGLKAQMRASYSIPALRWTVQVSSGTDPVMTSLNRLVLAYWAFVLGLAGSTVLAFSLLLGRVTSSLRDLTRAAEEIGEGELHPWLPLPPAGEVGQLTMAFDKMLSRVRQMMAQVDQNGRLAVVGQLSAYLAHEIRNPLSSIKLNLQRLMRWARSGRIPEYCLEPLEISLNEVERLNSSVNAVLQLSRSQDGPKEVVGLHVLLDEARALLADRFRRRNVELRMDLDAGADWVLARPGQVKSVILNLMVNALEAQSGGGRLYIRSELTRAPGDGGPGVALHFRDRGPGIPPEIRDRVFEPFFTTKKSGSGIGLAVAAQAVADNGGRIYLEEARGAHAGAEFVVVFPLAAIEAPRREEVGDGRQALFVGSLPAVEPARENDVARSALGAVPPRFLTAEGVKTLMALSPRDSEEVN